MQALANVWSNFVNSCKTKLYGSISQTLSKLPNAELNFKHLQLLCTE
jgi:hypothetical protein